MGLRTPARMGGYWGDGGRLPNGKRMSIPKGKFSMRATYAGGSAPLVRAPLLFRSALASQPGAGGSRPRAPSAESDTPAHR